MPFSLTTCGDDGVLDYYLLLGSPADILAGYTALTGRAPVPPAWPFGWWQSRCLYASAEEVLRVVREMRDAGIPMDVIHLDTNWFAVDWRCDLELAPDRFPWPQPARRVARDWIRLRYRLLPYVLAEAHRAAADGLPFARALVLEFPDDPTTWRIGDQFLCGRAILAAPLLEPGGRRLVYLPAGTWTDWWTRERLRGPRWLPPSHGLDTMPLYLREGAVVPMGRWSNGRGSGPPTP